jgi:hypothetical protein
MAPRQRERVLLARAEEMRRQGHCGAANPRLKECLDLLASCSAIAARSDHTPSLNDALAALGAGVRGVYLRFVRDASETRLVVAVVGEGPPHFSVRVVSPSLVNHALEKAAELRTAAPKMVAEGGVGAIARIDEALTEAFSAMVALLGDDLAFVEDAATRPILAPPPPEPAKGAKAAAPLPEPTPQPPRAVVLFLDELSSQLPLEMLEVIRMSLFSKLQSEFERCQERRARLFGANFCGAGACGQR